LEAVATFYITSCCHFVYSEDEEYWFGLYKVTPTVTGTTLWLDGNPSTYRWWSKAEPNVEARCISYTPTGFDDRKCAEEFLFMCKMLVGK